jgi:hypothetical protein
MTMSNRIFVSLFFVTNLTTIGAAQDPAPKISWSTHLNESFLKSVTERKPLVIYFYREHLGEALSSGRAFEVATCAHYERHLFPAPEFQAYGHQAVFAQVSISNLDPNGLATKILHDLKIERFPTVAAFDTTVDELKLRGKLMGLFNSTEFNQCFRKVFDNVRVEVKKDATTIPIRPADVVNPDRFGPADENFIPPSPFETTEQLIKFMKRTEMTP